MMIKRWFSVPVKANRKYAGMYMFMYFICCQYSQTSEMELFAITVNYLKRNLMRFSVVLKI